MITLEQLQEAGGLAGGYKRAAFTTAVSLSNLRMMSEEKQAQFNGSIILDNCQWAATTHGIPLAKASKVYSCDGKHLGCYSKDLRTFFELEFMENKLVTVGQYKLPEVQFKEERTMSNEFTADLDKLRESMQDDAMKGMGSFDSGASAAAPEAMSSSDKTPSAATIRKMKAEQEINEIRSKISGESIVDRSDAILNNQKFGRFICFITKTDPSVRLGVKKVPIVDENGKYIPTEDAPVDVVEKARTGEKKLPIRYAKTESSLVFKHTKPAGKPIGAVIATPVASEVAFTKLTGTKPVVVEGDSKDMVVRFLESNELHPYIANNYDKDIREDDRVMGARATMLKLKLGYKDVVDDKTGATTTVVTAALAPVKKEGRTSLLTDGNFVPMKVYQTINQQDLTEENKATLNLLIEQALSRGKSYDMLDDQSKANVTPSADGSYTSVWFNGGTPINVEKYDKTGQLHNVQLPVVVKKPTKDDPTKFTYTYQYNDLDSENGPLSNPAYQEIIKLTGKSTAEFKDAIKDFGRRRRNGGGSSAMPTLTADEYLQAIRSKNITVAGADSFKALQQKLEGLA